MLARKARNVMKKCCLGEVKIVIHHSGRSDRLFN